MNGLPVHPDRLIQFLDALLDDPQASPPPDLSAADVEFVRSLLRLYPIPVQPDARRRRVWQRVLAEAVARRAAVPVRADPAPLSKNGHQTKKEMEMITQASLVQVQPRQHALRGLWTLGLVAAIVVAVGVGLLLARDNNTPPDRGTHPGVQRPTLSPPPTSLPPTATPVPSLVPATSDQQVTATPIPAMPNADLSPLPPTALAPYPVPGTLPPANMVVTAEAVPSSGSGGGEAPLPGAPSGGPVPANAFASAEPVSPGAPLSAPSSAEVLAYNPGDAAALAWSPDGQFLAVARPDAIDLIIMHDARRPQVALKRASAQALAFSPDSRWLASAHRDGTVSLWDPLYSQGDPVATLNVSQSPLVKVSFSPDGSYLVIEAQDGTLHIWSLTAGTASEPDLQGDAPLKEGDTVTLWGCRATVGAGTPPAAQPLKAYTISAPFTKTHNGIDLTAPDGAPVTAAGTGTVVFAGWNATGYGFMVVIAHGDTYSLYAHLASAQVQCGQAVKEGDEIGTLGSTGNASGPLLHFEIRDSFWMPLDPVSFIPFN